MDELELERLKLELIKVGAAKAEMKFVIKQRLSEIKRVEEAILAQEVREKELNEKIAMEGNK